MSDDSSVFGNGKFGANVARPVAPMHQEWPARKMSVSTRLARLGARLPPSFIPPSLTSDARHGPPPAHVRRCVHHPTKGPVPRPPPSGPLPPRWYPIRWPAGASGARVWPLPPKPVLATSHLVTIVIKEHCSREFSLVWLSKSMMFWINMPV